MMDALMGIDVGTSSCKLTVFRKDGTVILTDTRISRLLSTGWLGGAGPGGMVGVHLRGSLKNDGRRQNEGSEYKRNWH